MLQLFPRRTDEHIPHEKCMVRSCADDSDVDSVAFIPSSKTIDDVNAIPCVQVIDSAFSVDFPDLTQG